MPDRTASFKNLSMEGSSREKDQTRRWWTGNVGTCLALKNFVFLSVCARARAWFSEFLETFLYISSARQGFGLKYSSYLSYSNLHFFAYIFDRRDLHRGGGGGGGDNIVHWSNQNRGWGTSPPSLWYYKWPSVIVLYSPNRDFVHFHGSRMSYKYAGRSPLKVKNSKLYQI
jgi:hypothetical protein